VVAILALGVLQVLPNRYTSTATLLVVQQQVPQRYVVPNSTTNVAVALQAMKQEILSRPQLLRMINEFGLYPKKRKRLAPEQLFALMLGDIDIAPVGDNPQSRDKDFDAFKISFTTENALLSQQITNNLTSLFINEYLRSGVEHATSTTNFLHQRVEEKGKELQAQEQRLAQFKLQHVGELPEQQQGNLGILTGLQGQLQNTMASLNRAQQQRTLLQAQLEATPRRRNGADIAIPVFIPGSSTPVPTTPLQAAQNELARLQSVRANLLGKGDTSQHPDVLRNQREIAKAEAAVRTLMGTSPRPPEVPATPASPQVASTETADDPTVAQLKASLEANRLEIESLTADEKRLKASINQYENRLNQTPVREQQQAGIMRDTEVLRQEYSDLLKKEQESELATNLEKQQAGRQFRLIDPASLPTVPTSPNRPKLSLGAVGGALGFGLALALLMELRDTSFYSEKDLTKHLEAPFVLGIPLLPTASEVRNRRWHNVFQWSVGTTIVIVVAAAEFYVYRHG
jgi:polysaccharide chain length determinant protein (PEP-CTERM system associated)